MITDMHCHFVPDAFFRFVEKRDEFAVKVERAEGEDVSLRIRGIVFDLNTTFFKLDRQVARLDRLGIDRTILSLATPFIDYHLDARLAVEAARIYNDRLAQAIDGNGPVRRLGVPAAAGPGRGRGRAAPLRARSRLRRRPRRLQRPRRLSAATSSSGRCSKPRSSSTCRCSSIPPIRPARSAPATTR